MQCFDTGHDGNVVEPIRGAELPRLRWIQAGIERVQRGIEAGKRLTHSSHHRPVSPPYTQTPRSGDTHGAWAQCLIRAGGAGRSPANASSRNGEAYATSRTG